MSNSTKEASSTSVNPFKEESPSPSQQRSTATNAAAVRFMRELAETLATGEFELPPFPDTALRIQKCVADPDSDIEQLGGIVATEPALAALIMRMANSVLMRRGPIEVTDIRTAISRVGMNMVQNAAMSHAAREAFQPPPGSPCLGELNALRKHSLRVAAVSFVLAQEVSAIKKPDEAMLAGLLSAIGKLYIFMKAADHPELFIDRPALDALIAQWHAGVARAIIDSWEFPESISHAVDEQDIEERNRLDTANISDLLFVANYIDREGPEAIRDMGHIDSLARMRMDAARLNELLIANSKGIRSMVDALGR